MWGEGGTARPALAAVRQVARRGGSGGQIRGVGSQIRGGEAVRGGAAAIFGLRRGCGGDRPTVSGDAGSLVKEDETELKANQR
jgi:hypothetical protein